MVTSAWFLHLQLAFLSLFKGNSYWVSPSNPWQQLIYSVPLLVCICLSCYPLHRLFTIWIPSSLFWADQNQILTMRALSLVGSYLIHGKHSQFFYSIKFWGRALPSWNHKMTLVYRVRVRQFPPTLVSHIIQGHLGEIFSWRNVFTKPFSTLLWHLPTILNWPRDRRES